ncbi:MAG: bifunctional hydroxymethylpyrimidine kinase/phosphomethylpyrimidine kinase [Acidobacteriota bacterium]
MAARTAKKLLPTAVSIAGSDSGGGAGIQADLLTFSAHGVSAATVVVAGTAQNSRGVRSVEPFTPRFVARQIDAVFSDFAPAAVKIGMLYDAPHVRAVAAGLRRHRAENVVLDPVLASTGGFSLLTPDGLRALRREILPLCAIVTPNRREAARLAGMRSARTEDDLALAARKIEALGAPAVLVTGGDGAGRVRDLLWRGETLRVFENPRIATRATHGTGCTLSSAIAANLALGFGLEDSVSRAIRYVRAALERGIHSGGGAGTPGRLPTSSRTGTRPRPRPSPSSRSAPRRGRRRAHGRGSSPFP